VPGKPEASLLVQAVRYTNPDLQMPPQGKRLAAAQVADLEAWVRMGAPDPRAGGPAGSGKPDAAEARAGHWAFQPVRLPLLPRIHKQRWVRTPVDAFVLAQMESRSLNPTLPASRRALMRRASYDLLGLPPDPELVEAFVADNSPGAWEGMVERLLGSPQFGERWGRFWLDVARYADTKGYLAGGEERRYPFAHTYRDYVIRAFNEDKPYTDFLVEQIAADRVVEGEDRRALAALGFLTLGRRFLNNSHDIIDDRIDVVMRGTQGLTVGCARCHDHKFDPISMRDYYGLHGIFASSDEPAEKPLLGGNPAGKEYEDYLVEVRKIEAEIEVFKDREVEKFASELRQQLGDYLLGAQDARALKASEDFDTWAGERKLNPTILRRWMARLEASTKQHDPVLAPWNAFAALTADGFAQAAEPVARRIAGNGDAGRPFNALLAAAFAQAPTSMVQVAAVYTRVGRETETAWAQAFGAASKEHRPAPAALADAGAEAVRQILQAEGTPFTLSRAEAHSLLARRLGEGSAPMRNRIEQLNWTHPGAPARAMALVDSGSPRHSRVLLRGNPGNPGAEAPRGFLEVLNRPGEGAFTNGSGRLQLARAIADPANPLTARVHVNRVWQQLFGQALVRTPGDFGIRTPAPVQRELLDYLAARFMQDGWSTKSLLRLILLSSTYQQSSEPDPRQYARDPDNVFLHHVPRRRLDFEAMRDTLLAVAGRLDLKGGGIAVDIVSEPFSVRRSVYAFVERQNLPGVFRTFDFANPDVCSPQRFSTTVPQQALFMMNSPFVLEQARAFARRPEVRGAPHPAARLATMIRLAWQRPPRAEEMDLALRFVQGAAPSPGSRQEAGQEAGQEAAERPDRWEEFAQVLLLSNELMFVD
jgi:hypothetical protein